jgi:cytochrome b6-f complex iron-sulfur subunit
MNRRDFLCALALPIAAASCTQQVVDKPEQMVLEADLQTELLQVGDFKQNAVIGVWVQRIASGNTPGSFRCLSMICTHARCNTVYQTNVQEFHCPCHQSKFNVEGRVLNGPAADPLSSMTFRILNGRLQVMV